MLEKNVSGGDGNKDAEFISHDFGLEPALQKNMLFAGSVIAHGEAAAIACDTGADTLMVRRGKTKVKKPDSLKLFTYMRRISSVCCVLLIVYVFIIAAAGLIINGADSIFPSFLLALSAAGVSLCELLCAIVYLVIGCGVYPGSGRADYATGAIIKNISSIEKLSRLTCLCVPKTGGICDAGLKAELTYTQNREYTLEEEFADRTVRLCRFAVASYGGVSNHSGKKTASTEEREAILSASAGIGAGVDEVSRRMLPVEYRPGMGESPVDCALVIFDGRLTICVRGSALHVVNRCTSYFKNGNKYPLDKDGREDLLKIASEYEQDICRVVAVAEKDSVYNNLDVVGYCERDLCFEGFIILTEPYSEKCVGTVAELSEMGIKTLMFAEDMSQQSVYLSAKLGICGADESQVLSAPEISYNNTAILGLKMNTYRCFRGLNQAQKKFVIQSFENSGETMGVIGQNLYDIALMDGENTVGFAANLTLARGKRKEGAEIFKPRYSGSEALKRAAGVIITAADAGGGGGISSARDAVVSARLIMNNIYKILLCLLAGGFCRVLLAAFCTVSPLAGLTVNQLIFSGTILDLCAVFSVALSKNKDETRGKQTLLAQAAKKPLKAVIMGLVTGAAMAALTVTAPLSARALGCADISVISFAALCSLQLFMIYRVIRGKSRRLKAGHSNTLLLTALTFAEYLALSAVFPAFYDKWLTGSLSTPYFACALIPVFIAAMIDLVFYVFKRK